MSSPVTLLVVGLLEDVAFPENKQDLKVAPLPIRGKGTTIISFDSDILLTVIQFILDDSTVDLNKVGILDVNGTC
jgi:hypothetical protein